MASYGYGGGNNYTTTSYGAQGGADGGGFVAGGGGYGGGSQTGSQDAGGGSRSFGKDTLRPVTIKQLIDAHQPHPDSEFKIDGTEVSQVTFVGQINTISQQTTNITYKVDDGTGLIEVKQWVDLDQAPELGKALPKEGDYLSVWGRLKSFNNKRHVGAQYVRPVTDFNEISYHLLCATAVHLYFSRGPPEGLAGAGVKSEGGNRMFVDGYGGGAGAAASGHKLPPQISGPSKKVFTLLQTTPQNNEGLHVQHIAAQLSMPVNDVFKAGDELLGQGLIYTTVDDETWAVLEY